MPKKPARSSRDERYGRRLAIIVPYRARAEQLAAFVPHIAMYFQRDKLDRQIETTIHIVEQSGTAPFNAGKLRNCGFALARDAADYCCFHDVDYLPIWADYSWSPKPCRLIWHGLTLVEDYESFFGAVVLFDNAAFLRVNGYPNCYWGWGAEDYELGQRCVLSGIGFECRDGTYQSLPHEHRGLTPAGTHTKEAQRTFALFEGRRTRLRELIAEDGLSTVDYRLLRKTPISISGRKLPGSFHYLLDIGSPP